MAGQTAGTVNWLDFVIVGIVGWFTLTAYLHGLLRETVGLAAVIGGIILAGLFHNDLAQNLDLFISNATAREIVAFVAILGTVAAVGWIAGILLRGTADLLLLGWADHAAGGIFGLLKGILLIQALAAIFVLQPALGVPAALHESVIGSFFLDTTPMVRVLLPTDFDQVIRQFAA